MAKTIADIMMDISIRCDDEGMVRFRPEVLRRFIYDGCKAAALRTECLRETQTIAVGADVAEVVGPTDAVRITMAQFQPTGQSMVYPLEYMDYSSMDQVWGPWQGVDQSSYPSYFTTWSFPPTLNIRLYPIPSEGGSLQVFYYRLPATIDPGGADDTNNIDLPSGWEELVTDYGCAQCWLKDRQTDMYQFAMTEFQSKIVALLETSVRYSDNAGQVDYWNGGGINYW